MSVNFNTLYNDRSLEGEHLLAPFKHSVERFGRSFKEWNDSYPSKFSGLMTRIADFIAGLFGMIGTSILVPVGMCMKYFSQPKKTELEIDPTKKETKVTYMEALFNYPGDLNDKEKQSINAKKVDSNTLSLSFNPGFVVEIRNQNMFQSGAHTIVNAANTHLGGGGGIDGAIHKNGGDEYAEAHKQLKIKYDSNYTEGFASIISSGALAESHNIYNVIVVAGPQGGYNNTKAGQLYSCYYNSLQLAHENGIKSIAFPSISTGEFSFPKEEAARIVLRAMFDFQKKHPITSLEKISVHFLNGFPEFDISFYTDAL